MHIHVQRRVRSCPHDVLLASVAMNMLKDINAKTRDGASTCGVVCFDWGRDALLDRASKECDKLVAI